MKFKINALSIYEYGQRKDKEGNPHQEDWIYPVLGKVDNENDRLFILCDGMGGHAAGEVASSTVCEAMSRTINDALQRGENFSEELLLKAIDAAYDLLDERDTTEDGQKKMGTTMTFLMLHEGGATIAHIGDSRVYQIRPHTGKKEDVLFQTEDHSLVNDLLKIGELTPEEAETYPQKNVITRAMQPNLERRHKADIVIRQDILPGDYFYMCSDGMLEQTSNDNLCFMLNKDISDEKKRNNLIEMSKYNRDNHSAHLIHILDVLPTNNQEEKPFQESSADNVTEEEDDIVKPEFDNTDTTEAANSENAVAPKDKSTAIEKKENALPATPTVQESSTSKSKLVWGILMCLIIATIAVCVLFFTGFLENVLPVSPQDEEQHISNPSTTINPRKRNSSNPSVTTPAVIQPSVPANPVAPAPVQEVSGDATPTVEQSSHPQVSMGGDAGTGQNSPVKSVRNAIKKRSKQAQRGLYPPPKQRC